MPARRVLWATLSAVILGSLCLVACYRLVEPPGAAWEREWLLALHGWVPAGWHNAALVLTQAGYPPAVTAVLVVLGLAWLLARTSWKTVLLLCDSLIMIVLTYGGKPFFERPRPELFPHPAVAGLSFPSGHALLAIGFYGFVAYLLLHPTRGWARGAGWLLYGLFALSQGATRLVLGLHWPSDVLAGYLAGAVVLLLLTRACPRRASHVPGFSRELRRQLGL